MKTKNVFTVIMVVFGISMAISNYIKLCELKKNEKTACIMREVLKKNEKTVASQIEIDSHQKNGYDTKAIISYVKSDGDYYLMMNAF